MLRRRVLLNGKIDYTNRIMKLNYLDVDISAQQFKAKVDHLQSLIVNNPSIADVLKGDGFPVVLPKIINYDIGTVLYNYLKLLKQSYAKTFPLRKFHCECCFSFGAFINRVSSYQGSYHDKLIERMRKESVVGIYFPRALRKNSVDGSREQMVNLVHICQGDENIVLSGLDVIIAMIMYPDILAVSRDNICLQLSALSWKLGNTFNFRVYDKSLFFNSTDVTSRINDGDSSGLLLF